MLLDIFVIVATCSSVCAQSLAINSECAKALQTASTTFGESKSSIQSYAGAHAPFSKSIQPSLGTFVAFDAAPFNVQEGDMLSTAQKQTFTRVAGTTKALQLVTNRNLKASAGDDASDVLEDLDVAQFSMTSAKAACVAFM